MKLLVQSDDYGITKAVSLGIIEAIKFGIVKNTGMFANMPSIEEHVDMIKPFLKDIAFGVDLNISTGPSVLNRVEIPTLVQENGDFLTSTMHRELSENDDGQEHLVYEEVYKEFDAQIKKYIMLVGKRPDYLHPHAYTNRTIISASKALAKKYEIPYSLDVFQRKGFSNNCMGWYKFPPTLSNQLKSNLKEYILMDENQYLNHEYGSLVCHCGYIDADLFNYSSFNLYRANDLAAMTDDEVKKWIVKNKIELITYKSF